MIDLLPHLNAMLNATSAALLVGGWRFARAGRRDPHRRCMTAAFGCSVLFLVGYLTRYFLRGNHVYPGEGLERALYLCLLASHVVLAALVPFLALRTLHLALRDQVARHRRWARWTLPIWLWVSVTGVGVYWMLYHHAGVGTGPVATGQAASRSSANEASTASTKTWRSGSSSQSALKPQKRRPE